MFFLDANILLEVMLNQKQADECANFLQKLEKGPPICYLTDFLLYSMLLTILRYESPGIAKKFLSIISSYERILIYRPTLLDLDTTLSTMPLLNLDFDDAMVVTIMQQTGLDTVVSFDHHFDSIAQINRMEPKEAHSLL
jgi:predicted nucleic acid-binding protein